MKLTNVENMPDGGYYAKFDGEDVEFLGGECPDMKAKCSLCRIFRGLIATSCFCVMI